MAIVATEELIQGRSVSGTIREGFKYKRQFIVQTDAANTSLLLVARAPAVHFGDPHPDDASVMALGFDCQAIGDNPLLFQVSVDYGVPPADDSAPAAGGGGGGGGSAVAKPDFTQPPGDVWSGSSELVTVGALTLPKTPGGVPVRVVNTAGVPVAGVSTEQARLSLTLARSYKDLSFLPKIIGNTNKVNSAAWSGCSPYTWLCKGARWSREVLQNDGVNMVYYRVTWEFNFNPRTWNYQFNSIGYQELKGGKLVDIMNDETPPQPISEPRALGPTGAALPPGAEPAQVIYHPHAEIDFSTEFGAIT